MAQRSGAPTPPTSPLSRTVSDPMSSSELPSPAGALLPRVDGSPHSSESSPTAAAYQTDRPRSILRKSPSALVSFSPPPAMARAASSTPRLTGFDGAKSLENLSMGPPGSESPSGPRLRADSMSPLMTAHLKSPEKKVSEEDLHLERRRAVSDAAQLLRTKMQMEKKRELMAASSVQGQPHNWSTCSFVPPVYCAICTKLCWGLGGQGLRCSECGIELHRGCETGAPSCLGRLVDRVPTALSLPPFARFRRVRIVVVSAEGLVRRTLFRMPDPFIIVSVDGKSYSTSAARKTLSPKWNDEHECDVSISSNITFSIFDARKFQAGTDHGFLGLVTVPASAYLDVHSLADGASATHTFRLKKHEPDDVVTGSLTVTFVAVPPPRTPPARTTTPIPIPMRMRSEGAASVGSLLPGSPFASFVPPRPSAPTCAVREEEGETVIDVTWTGFPVGPDTTDMTYTLAVIPEGSERYHDIYTGRDTKHTAQGLKPGQSVSFAIRAGNFYGSSDYSLPSPPVLVPKREATRAAARPHCPLFMAGYCFRGAHCPMSHGTGLQTPDDVAAALLAAAYIGDPDIQLAVAIEASLTDMAQHATGDDSKLPKYMRDFYAKERQFRNEVPQRAGECRFTVSRADLFKSSFFEVTRRPPAELRSRLAIQFLGEGGLDYGGLAREWFFLLSHEIFHPSYGMFEASKSSNYKLQINPASALDEDHLLYFQFVGRVMAMAVVHRHLLDAVFVVSFYKKILGMPVTLSDMQDTDADVHRSLLWVLETEIASGDAGPGITFVADYDRFGEVVSHELIPGGASIPVDESNKHEFVRLMVEWRLARGTQQQMAALLYGFHEIIPRRAILKFNERELEFLLSGSQQIDLEDWRENSIYQGYAADAPVIRWFWELVEEASDEQKRQILQFCTGSTRVPLDGFRRLQGSDGPRRFCVQRVEDLTRLPSAHTCFNRLDLPPYPTKQMLHERLMLSVSGAQGFTGD
eukprot:m.20050 g.20050  ORF g.20050 m.20050 type:complete len:978 (-) comp7730_c0_seq1:22-2955(-)